MNVKDTGLHFGLVSVISHWLGAACLTAFSAGVLWEVASGDPMVRNATLALGGLTACLHTFRLIWRLKSYHPTPLGGANPAQVLVGRGVALGMLLAGVVLPTMYWVLRGSTSFSVPWWVTPLFWLGFTCFFLGLALHLFGAYTHVFKLKDDSLKRMFGFTVDL